MSTMSTVAPERLAAPVPRLVPVRANLIPAEITDARRARAFGRRVLISLGILCAVLVAAYGLTLVQTMSAKSSLDDARSETTTLQGKVAAFGPLVRAQSQTAQIGSTLDQVMTGDLPWAKLLAAVQAAGGPAVHVTGVTGGLTTGDTTTAASTAPTTVAGTKVIGTLNLTGTAASKDTLASYLEALAKVRGLAAPEPATLTGTGFTATVLITADALGGRFTPSKGGH